MEHRPRSDHMAKIFFFSTLAFCALLISAIVFLASRHGGNDLHSYSEPVVTLADGWTITDSAGNARAMTLPETISYGADGVYTLSRTLPKLDGALASPTFRFYSNYVDVRITLDGRTVYTFPATAAQFSGATGNTYHFVRLPADYAGKTITVTIRCQLGSTITYLLNPPLFGSKATMLQQAIMRSLPAFTLAGCMCILAIGLVVLYFLFHRRLSLDLATLNNAVFALLFSFYVYFETSFAQQLMPNGYLLCFVTLMLLALLPLPLLGVFLESVSRKYRPLLYGLMFLCVVNLFAQMLLNYFGVLSVRAMLPATHVVIMLTIFVASLCLFISDRTEKPRARRDLYSAAPMIAGVIADIILLNINRPSLNNSLWFTLGVMIFLIHQLHAFVSGYFALYRNALETRLFVDMAYHDMLSGIGNRNAYERKLKELGKEAPSPQLCCIVLDINDLKIINDTLGHQSGDTAIATVGTILTDCMPECAAYYRTGGDEFVILLEPYDERRTQALAEKITSEARRYSGLHAIPIRLAIGFGQYDASDGNVLDFIRRVDTRMYACKRQQKNGNRS